MVEGGATNSKPWRARQDLPCDCPRERFLRDREEAPPAPTFCGRHLPIVPSVWNFYIEQHLHVREIHYTGSPDVRRITSSAAAEFDSGAAGRKKRPAAKSGRFGRSLPDGDSQRGTGVTSVRDAGGPTNTTSDGSDGRRRTACRPEQTRMIAPSSPSCATTCCASTKRSRARAAEKNSKSPRSTR
jgi:hypothetical protein